MTSTAYIPTALKSKNGLFSFYLLPWGDFIGNTAACRQAASEVRRLAPDGLIVRRFGGHIAFYSSLKDRSKFQTRPSVLA